MCPPPCFPGLSKSTKIGDKGAQLPSSLLTSTLTTNKNVLKGRGVSAIQLWDVKSSTPLFHLPDLPTSSQLRCQRVSHKQIRVWFCTIIESCVWILLVSSPVKLVRFFQSSNLSFSAWYSEIRVCHTSSVTPFYVISIFLLLQTQSKV